MKKKSIQESFVPYLFLGLVLISISYLVEVLNQKVYKLTMNEFMSALNSNEITVLEITPQVNAGVYEITGTMEDYKKNESFVLKVPYTNESIAVIYDAVDKINEENKENK